MIPNPYYDENGITLYHADCLDVLPQIESESQDLVLTDPAYESLNRWEGVGTTARMGMGRKGTDSDDLENKWFDTFPNDNLPDLIQGCHRVLKDQRHAYFFCDWETIKLLHYFAIGEGVFAPVGYGGIFEPCKPLVIRNSTQAEIAVDVAEHIKFWLDKFANKIDPKTDEYWSDLDWAVEDLLNHIGELCDDTDSSALIWDKVIQGLGYTYRASYEFVLMLWKGKKRKLNDLGVPDVLSFKKPWGKQRLYPTQKPVELCELLIRQSTQEGETVIDPFIGGGTTAIAALRTGRKLIGIDKSKRALDTTIGRIEQELGIVSKPKIETQPKRAMPVETTELMQATIFG